MNKPRPKNPVWLTIFLCFVALGLYAQACPVILSSSSSPDCNPTCNACPGDQITFSVTGNNLLDAGTINWYESNLPGFDPYLGQGTLIGSSAISTPASAPCTDCPEIMAIMVDACGMPEGANEFMMISSGSGFTVSDLVLNFDMDNNAGGPGSADIGIIGGICNWGPGDPGLITGCAGTTIITPGPSDFIPAGATVLLQTSNGGTTVYDFSATCGATDCIYVIRNSCTRGSFGGFSNCASSGIKFYEILLNSCACSNIASYDTDASSCTGGDGMYFVPGGGFANDGCNLAPGAVAPPPTPSISTVTDFVYNITTTDCNQGPVYIVGIPNPEPSACCSDVYTDYFEINVICPSAAMGIDLNACDDGSGQAIFNLNSLNASISGGLGTVNWFLDMAGTMDILTPGSFTAGNNTSVYAQVVNGCPSEIVEVTLFVDPSGSINAGNDITSCGQATISLTPIITPIGTAITWTTSGNGTFSNPNSPTTGYVPSLADVAAGSVTLTLSPDAAGGCVGAPDDLVVTLLAAPIADIGGPYAPICANQNIILNGTISGGAIGGMWSSGGTGTFDDPTSPNAIYTPSLLDIGFGTVTLTFTALAAPGCVDDTDGPINVNILASPFVNITGPTFICGSIGQGYLATIGGAFSGIVWSTSGSGTFSNPNGTLTDYDPGPTDLPGTTVTLTATVGANNGCPATVETYNVLIDAAANFNTGFPTSICAGDVVNLDFSATQPIDLAQWNTAGDGFFVDPNALVTIYNPGPADILSGSLLLQLVATDSPCPGATFNIGISIEPEPLVGLSAMPTSACVGETFALQAPPLNSNTGSVDWSTGGDGTFSVLSGNNTVYTPGPADAAAGTVNITATANSIDVNCAAQTYPIVLTITDGPTADINVVTPSCEDDPIDFSVTLGGGATTANWSSNGDGTFVPVSGSSVQYTPGTNDLLNGSYTITAISDSPSGGCPPGTDSELINIIEGATVSIAGPFVSCETDIINLIAAANADAGNITWSSSGGGTFSTTVGTVTTYTPSAGDVLIGNVNITATSEDPTGPCSAVNDIINIDLIPAPNAGVANTGLNFCSNDASSIINLNTELSGQDLLGIWSETSVIPSSGVAFNSLAGTFDFNGQAAGIYAFTYTVNGAVPCNPDMETVSIEIIDAPTATFQSPIAICNTTAGGSILNFNNLILSGDNSGSWADGGSGVNLTNLSSVDFNGVVPSIYTFTYTTNSATAPCLEVDFSVNITVENCACPSPTVLDVDDLCDNQTALDLSSFELGDAGSWSITDTPAGSNPATLIGDQLNGMNADAGIYELTFTLDAAPLVNCPDSSVQYIELFVFNEAGQDDILSFCNAGDVDLSTYLTNADAGGSWQVNIASPNALPGGSLNSSSGLLNTALLDGDYLIDYFQDNADPCADDAATFTISVGNPVVDISGDATGCGTEFEVLTATTGFGTYSWSVPGSTNQISVNLTGWYYVGVTDNNLCPAVDSFFYESLLIPQSNLTGNYCDGDVVMVGLDNYDSVTPSGQTTLPGMAANGCDSIVNVNLTFSQEVVLTAIDTMLCPGESIEVNGVTFDAGNLSGQVLFNNSGCDSTQNVTVGFLTIPQGNLTGNYCDGEIVMVGTDAYDSVTPSGQTTLPGMAENGCDSLVNVNLTFVQEVVLSAIDTMLCPGESIEVNGITFDAGNLSGQVLFNNSGCDSTQNVTVAYLTIPQGNLTGNYCGSEVVMVGTDSYDSTTPSGQTILPGMADNGCDSLVNVSLTFTPEVVLTAIDTMLCPGESIEVNGITFDASNLSGQVLFNNSGCDSTQNVTVGYLTIPQGNLTGNYCDGEVVMVGSDSYDSTTPSGQTTLPGMADNGCDSLVNVSLTFTQEVVLTAIDTMLCPGESIEVNGITFDASNLSGQVLFNNSGCDSTQNVTVAYLTIPQGNLTGAYCDGDVVLVGTDSYDSTTPSGQTTLPGMAENGCDSLVNVSLTFTQEVVLTAIDTLLCPGEFIEVNGTTFDASNLSGQVVFNNSGCDSTQNVTVAYLTIPQGNFTGSYCDGDVVMVGTDNYDSTTPSGQTTLSGMAANGCDSLVNVSLTFNQEVVLTAIDTMLCPGDFIEINGTTFDDTNLSGQVIFNTAGCDSTQNVTIGFYTIPEGIYSENFCIGDVVMVGTDSYDSTNPFGQTTLPGMAANGCDSLVNVSLSFSQDLVLTPIDTLLCPGGFLEVNGVTFDAANLSGQVVFNTSGCDSTQNVTIGFYTIPIGTLSGNYCDGDQVMVGTDIYDNVTPSGQTTLSGMAANGCDSLVNVNLTFSQEVTLVPLDTLLCPGGSIVVNGITFDAGNLSGQVLFNTAGCDSTQNVTIGFLPIPEGNFTGNYCIGDQVMVGLDVYDSSTPSGQTTLPGMAATGCDSLVNVNLFFDQEVILPPLDTMICDGSSLVVNGVVFDETNTSGQVIFNNAGCDSLQNVSIGFLMIPEGFYSGAFCIGDEIIIGPDTYSSTNPFGQSTLPGMAANGCDSLVNVSLSFSQEITLTPLDTLLCPGESILINGITFNESNLSGQVIFNTSGCDSTQNVNIAYYPVIAGTLSGDYCEGDQVMVGTDIYDSSTPIGQTVLPGMASFGCDSIVNVNLTFSQEVVLAPIDSMLCPGGFIEVNGIIFDATNMSGLVTFDNGGCDSTQLVNIGFFIIPITNYNETLCEDESVQVGPTTYDAGNPFGQTTITSLVTGCDSIVNVDLNFVQLVVLTPIDTILCEGNSMTINGVLFDEFNTSAEVIFNNGGCDSTQQVDVSFVVTSMGFYSDVLCEEGTFTLDGDLYDIDNPSGETTLSGASQYGCDSTVMVDLTFMENIVAAIATEEVICENEEVAMTFTINDNNPFNVEILVNGTPLQLLGIFDGHVEMLSITDATTLVLSSVDLIGFPCPIQLPLIPLEIEVAEIDLSLDVISDYDGLAVSCETAEDGVVEIVGLGQGNLTYEWEGGVTPDLNQMSPGNYSVTMIDANNCRDSIDFSLDAPPAPILNSMNNDPTCPDETDGQIIITEISGNTASFEYALNGDFFQPIDQVPFVISNLPAGNFQLEVADENGCSITSSVNLNQATELFASAQAEEVILLGDSTQIFLQPTFNAEFIEWQDHPSLSCTDCLTPFASPIETTTYYVELEDEAGCRTTVEVTIKVKIPTAYLPNIFSPNDDGANDWFFIQTGVDDIEIERFIIADRWGEIVFVSTETQPNIPNYGWDGTLNGEALNPDVYVYYIVLKLANGNPVNLKGDITLIR